MMYNNYQDYQRDVIESQLLDRIDWEQEQANMADYYANRKQQAKDELVEYLTGRETLQTADAQRREMEDMKLASDLRDLADRIEARYK